jgi:hypothetical protein
VIYLKYVRVHWDRAGAVAFAIAGIVMLIVGYTGAADTQYISEQIPYVISAGFGGVIALSVAAALWLSADMRDEWRELVRQGEKLDALLERR